MHDDLIRRLNEYSATHENHGGITAEAADAIEQLTKLVDAQLDIIKQYQEYLNKRSWIPVTKKLPEETAKVLVQAGEYYYKNSSCKGIVIGWRNGPYWSTFTAKGCESIRYPLAWMPLPDQYNGYYIDGCESELKSDAAETILEMQEAIKKQRDLLMAFGGETVIRKLKEYADKYLALLEKHRWIPVEEFLPDECLNVIVSDGKTTGMGWIDSYVLKNQREAEKTWYAPNTSVVEENITHWQPLPQPPKEGS